MEVKNTEVLMVGIPSKETTDVMIKPILENYPIFQDNLKLFKIYFDVVKKKTLTHLSPPNWLVQTEFTAAQSEAGTIKPLGAISHESDEIEPKIFEIFYRVFPEQIAEAVDAIERGVGVRYHKVDGNPEMEALLNAFISLLEVTWGNNIYTMTFFSSTDFALPTGITLDADATKNAKIVAALSKFDGIWKTIEDAVDAGKVKHVDLEDLTQDRFSASAAELVEGGASPVVIQDNELPSDFDYNAFFKYIKDESTKELRKHGSKQTILDKPKMLVTPNIYDGYKEYLRKTYTANEKGYELTMKGRNEMQITWGLEWDGYAIVEVSEWEDWYETMGKANHIRVLFEAPQNLTIATRAGVVVGSNAQVGLLAMERTEPELIGAVDVRATFGMDTGLASNVLITAAY